MPGEGDSEFKVPGSGQLFIWGKRFLDYSELKVPSSDQIFILVRGGGILDYSRIRYSWQNEQKFCHAPEGFASQIISHTLRVLRLNSL